MTAVQTNGHDLTAGLVAKLCAEAAARHDHDEELSEIEAELRKDLGELSWDRNVKYRSQPYSSGASALYPAPPATAPPTDRRPQAGSKAVQATNATQKSAAEEPKPPPPAAGASVTQQPPPPPPGAIVVEDDDLPEDPVKQSLGRLVFQGGIELDGELHLISINEMLDSEEHFISAIDLDQNSETTLKVSPEEIIRASGALATEMGPPSNAQLQAVCKHLRLKDGILTLEAASDAKEPAAEVPVRRTSCIDMLSPADLGGGDDIPGVPGSAGPVKSADEGVRDKVLDNLLSLAECGKLEEVIISSLAP